MCEKQVFTHNFEGWEGLRSRKPGDSLADGVGLPARTPGQEFIVESCRLSSTPLENGTANITTVFEEFQPAILVRRQMAIGGGRIGKDLRKVFEHIMDRGLL